MNNNSVQFWSVSLFILQAQIQQTKQGFAFSLPTARFYIVACQLNADTCEQNTKIGLKYFSVQMIDIVLYISVSFCLCNYVFLCLQKRKTNFMMSSKTDTSIGRKNTQVCTSTTTLISNMTDLGLNIF